MTRPPLNPDGIEAAASILCDETAGQHTRYAELKTGIAKKLWGQRAEHVVSAYLAAALPEVTSVEELDQLPVESVVMDKYGYVYLLDDDDDEFKWSRNGIDANFPSWGIILPARVLYRPEVKP